MPAPPALPAAIARMVAFKASESCGQLLRLGA
jgi:hypothetical protein